MMLSPLDTEGVCIDFGARRLHDYTKGYVMFIISGCGTLELMLCKSYQPLKIIK